MAAITGLAIGVLAPFVYAAAGLVYTTSPETWTDWWVCSPGAGLLSAGLCVHLARLRWAWRWRLVYGAAVGAIGGMLNYPLELLVETRWLGGPTMTLLDALESVNSTLFWQVTHPEHLRTTAFVFVSSGAILGYGVGALCRILSRDRGSHDP